MAGVTCLDIEEEISDQGLLRADDLNSVQKLLESVNVKPKSRACFATFVATYGDVEVQSIQIEFRESEEYPKFLDKLNGIFSGAPEGAMYSFRRKMRSFTFKPNRLYSDWLPAQELDVKVIKSFSLNILNVPNPSLFQFYESYETKLKEKNVEAGQDKLNAWGITDFLVRCFLVPDVKDYSVVNPRFVALPVPLDQRRTLADWHIAKEVSKNTV